MKNARFFALSIPLFLAATLGFSQEQKISLGNLSFGIAPKVLEDGSITDISLGYRYAEKMAATLGLRLSNEAVNEKLLPDVPESLNAITVSNTEVFLFPLEYSFLRRSGLEAYAGIGAYYKFHHLKEEGFLDDAGHNYFDGKVNYYTNDFSMHEFGPDIDIGFSFRADWPSSSRPKIDLSPIVDLSIKGGIVPIFFLSTKQEMWIKPYMAAPGGKPQETSGSPYVYFDINGVFLKYLALSFMYEYSKLDYIIGLDLDSSSIESQSIKVDVSLLIPIGGMSAQIGYGWIFDSTTTNKGTALEDNRQYVIFTAKKSR